MIEQVKCVYSPPGKAFEKWTKTIEDQDKKQVKVLQEHGKQLVEYSGKEDSFKWKINFWWAC